jgi:thymidylate kinase
VLITFSGLDGAGKTTLINWLRTTLEHQDRAVAVYHMNDQVGVYAYARSLRDRLWGLRRPNNGGAGASRAHPPASRSVRVTREHRGGSRLRQLRYTILWNKPLRRLLYPVDLLIFLGYRLWVEGIQGKILVMDRYFYDSLVDVADGRNWGLLRVLERITPVPDVPIFLDVDPEVASHRKNEHTLAYLRQRWAAYREVFQWVDPTVKLTDLPLPDAQSALQQVLLVRLPPS